MLGVGSIVGAIVGIYGHALAGHWLTITTGFPAPFSIGVAQVFLTLALIIVIALAVIALPGLVAARVSPRASACRSDLANAATPRVRNSIPVVRAIHKNGLWFAADFVCTARRYWLAVFPRVALEIRRRRMLCHVHPRPQRCVAWHSRRSTASEAISRGLPHLRRSCPAGEPPARHESPRRLPGDLRLSRPALRATHPATPWPTDIGCMRPSSSPPPPGSRIATTTDHHPRGDDGGYLMALVDAVRAALSALPSILSDR